MSRRSEPREVATPSEGLAEDKCARPVVVAKLRVVTCSMMILVALMFGVGLQHVAAADETRPIRLRQHDANRIDRSDISELGGYTESRQSHQRGLGKKRKKVRHEGGGLAW